MQLQLDDWQRVERVVRWAGLSTYAFAKNIGLSRAENLYQIKRGNHGVSKELAEAITSSYPEISRAWLLTGEGDMFMAGSSERSAIPCYEVDVMEVVKGGSLPQPAYLVSIPRARGVTFGALNLGSAMSPSIPQGAMLLMAEADRDKIAPGVPYIVVTDSFSLLRTVRREPDSPAIRLVAKNPECDDVSVDPCQVIKLYAVKGFLYYCQEGF